MEFFKCNLYILGNGGVGKSFFRRTIEEFIHFEKKSAMDKFSGRDWHIHTEDFQIEVDIKEYRNSEFAFIPFESKEAKNIILYITSEYEYKLEYSIPQKDVEQLKSLSNEALIIIATPLFRPYELNKDFNFNSLKKNFPFVEYFLPIHDFHYREYENSFQMGYVLRQIIVNSYPNSLKHAKELIRLNLQTENTMLDLGNCGLTSLNEVKELFQNTHLKKLILSNEWGEFQNGGWERKISNNKLEPNVLFGFPQEIGNLKNLEILIAGGNWKTSRKRTRYFSSNWYITDIKPLSRLKKLSVLNLSNNEIETVLSLYQLSHLTKLYLNNNSISNLPSIDKFPELNELISKQQSNKKHQFSILR